MSGSGGYEPTRLPPPRRTSPWFVLGVVLVSTIGGVAILGGFYATFLLRGRDLIVNEEDRATVVTAGYLEGLVDNFVLRTDGETLYKREYHNGGVVLAYEYDHPAPDRDLLLRCEIVVEPTVEAAIDQYIQRAEKARGSRSGGAEYKVDNQLLRWGDVSEFAQFIQDEQIIGNSFIGRYNNRVVQITVRDASITDQTGLAAVLAPALAAMEDYNPTPGRRK